MKKLISILAAFVIALSGMQGVIYAEESGYVYYVATDGKDSADGSIDAPFRTIERARTAVRELREQGIDDNATIYLRGGEYFRFKSFKLTEKDYNMTISAYGDEAVSITGGKGISSDKITSASDTAVGQRVIDETARQKLMVADLGDIYHYIENNTLPDHDADRYTVRLYTDGKPYEMSTYPDSKADALKMTGVDEADAAAFTYSDDKDRQLQWSDETISNMYVYGKLSAIWYIEFEKIAALDKTNKKVTVATPRATYSMEQSEFIFKNIAEEINTPGECYFDNADRKVYYYPYTNQVNDIVLAVSKEALINGKGTKNIQFKNIAFEYSRTNLFSVSESDNVEFENCDFKHFTQINTLNGNGNKMTGCNFYNGSRGGLLFSGGDAKTLTGGGNVIDNCVFDDLANVRPSYAAAISMSGYNNTVKNSEIKNSEHLLMQVGGSDQIIDGNKIHHGVQWTTDMGAVYYGRTATTIGVEFKNNEFYDNHSISGDYGSHSIYWDDRAIGPWIHDNIFYNTDKEDGMKVNSTALKSNAGVYATVENNTFVNIEPIRNQDYNFGKNQHIVFWLLCNNKPTLIKDDTSFQGWWDKIKESGYFGAWQEHYKNSVWEDYLTILTEERYNEVKDITNQSELIAIAEKYAPTYGINRFVNNIVYGVDENSDLHTEAMQYNTQNGNIYTDRTDVFEDFAGNNFKITDEGYKILKYGIENGKLLGCNITTDGNKITLRGFVDDGIGKEKIISAKIYSGDELIYFDQKSTMSGKEFIVECISDKTDDLRAVISCDGKIAENGE